MAREAPSHAQVSPDSTPPTDRRRGKLGAVLCGVCSIALLLVLAIGTARIGPDDLGNGPTPVIGVRGTGAHEFEIEQMAPLDVPRDLVEQQSAETPYSNFPEGVTDPAQGSSRESALARIAPTVAPYVHVDDPSVVPYNGASGDRTVSLEPSPDDGVDWDLLKTFPESDSGQAARRVGFRTIVSDGSDAAVAAAFKWIAEHQMPDGGWNFDHRGGKCEGRCDHAGSLDSARNAATAMALLAFLGAGQTHEEGDYKKRVESGLLFLLKNAKLEDGRATFEDGGNMYSHGMCTLALCEAFAMTHDMDLQAPAQAALNHIVFAQDPDGGGWRYKPKMPGDTSVSGWQIMALKSGHLGELVVPADTITGVNRFLDSVQSDEGAAYGYTDRGNAPSTNSVGLLCRMYTGWKRDNPALERGVKRLAETGPSNSNMYYNYFATQVLRHHEGDEWDTWREKLSKRLVETQSKEGHTAGSWYFDGDHGSTVGGRLYCTAMATMILEVYYRHMPIYGRAATADGFAD